MKQQSVKPVKKEPLKTGVKAPEFTLKATPDQEVALADFKGKPVVLIFYPADFSPVCTDEVSYFNSLLPKFRKYHVQLLGISVDNIWSHLAFSREREIHFPLLSDFHPKGAVCRLYNAYREENGHAERALYAIGKDGNIVWGNVFPVGINPGAEEVLEVLENLENSKERG